TSCSLLAAIGRFQPTGPSSPGGELRTRALFVVSPGSRHPRACREDPAARRPTPRPVTPGRRAAAVSGAHASANRDIAWVREVSPAGEPADDGVVGGGPRRYRGGRAAPDEGRRNLAPPRPAPHRPQQHGADLGLAGREAPRVAGGDVDR